MKTKLAAAALSLAAALPAALHQLAHHHRVHGGAQGQAAVLDQGGDVVDEGDDLLGHRVARRRLAGEEVDEEALELGPAAADPLDELEGEEDLRGVLDDVHPPLRLRDPGERALHAERELEQHERELVPQLAGQRPVERPDVDGHHRADVVRRPTALDGVGPEGARDGGGEEAPNLDQPALVVAEALQQPV